MAYISYPALGVLVLFVIVSYLSRALSTWRTRQKFKKEHGCLSAPKYPHKDPFFGYDLFRANLEAVKKSKLLETWTQRFEKYGDTFTANFLGTPAICTVDPLNVQTFLGTDFKNYGVQPLRRKATLPFLGEGVFTMDGSFWEYSRNLVKPTFSRANVANLESFETHLQNMLDCIPEPSGGVDLKPLLCEMFIDSSTEFLFEESLSLLKTDTPARSQEFVDAFHYCQKGTARRMQLGRLDFLHRDKKFEEAIKIVNNFADYYVAKAIWYRKRHESLRRDGRDKGEGKERYVLLREMALETDNGEVLRNQIIHVFLAGHESSAITIGNAIFQLSRNPKIWDKVRAEVLTQGDDHPTIETLKNMTYLQHVIKETLRLYPVASTATRVAYNDAILPMGGGPDRKSHIFVKKGSIVMTPTYSLHRRAKCFQPDPETFRPERWDDLKPGPSYIPFGWAPRTCPAQNMAEIEVAYTLARMAQEFRAIECRDDTAEWVEEIRLSTSSKNGTRVTLIPA